ncbi:MAG: hypothetical protein WC140_01655 [Bacteroidales bacterium]
MKKFLILISFIIISLPIFSQHIEWNINMQFKFDNREYSAYSEFSKTRFGVTLIPEVGVDWGNGHHFRAGANILRDFGNIENKITWNYLCYYSYNSKNLDVYAGAFPNIYLIGDYPRFILSDDERYFNSDLEGLALQYHNDKGYIEFVSDWRSKYSSTTREIFSLYSATDWNFGDLHLGNYLNMVHYSCSEIWKNAVDNIWISPYVGYDFGKPFHMDKCLLRVGYLQTFQRDRIHDQDFKHPGGALIMLKMANWKFGLDNTLFLGENLMPYYYVNNDPTGSTQGTFYSTNLYTGENSYGTESGCYNRLEFYWLPKTNEFVNLKVSAVLHIDGYANVGWQQLIFLEINLNKVYNDIKFNKR